MKFQIEATSIWRDKHERLIKEYPMLADYGYEVETKDVPVVPRWIKDENGRFIKFHTGETKTIHTPYITVNSLEQLMEFIKRLEGTSEIIVSEDFIEIYDGYRE